MPAVWLAVAAAVLAAPAAADAAGPAGDAPPATAAASHAVDLDGLADDEAGRRIRYGRLLLTDTSAHLGPLVADPAKRYAGSNMACANCHLDAGTKHFGLSLTAAYGSYPAFSTQSGTTLTIEDRVNSCWERSMNGRAMAADAPEMQAIVAYLRFLSERADAAGPAGAGSIAYLDRAADPAKGRAVFKRMCVSCHNVDGSGLLRDRGAPELGYVVPPLWGADSFNDGAGMYHLSTLANFAHSNMPNGTSWQAPRLSPEEAWDVAAFVVSQPRPAKAGLANDYPNRLDKPADTPYGPYADGFDETQHKYGPFPPIEAALKRLRAAAAHPPEGPGK
ncbi:c-type cytochrome [Faunimonas sp. B44]|uniref:c-type cytochrome n=1 Tax=Faunimonas sp. B44 TaxID=3461493 RepID=UPI00404413E1